MWEVMLFLEGEEDGYVVCVFGLNDALVVLKVERSTILWGRGRRRRRDTGSRVLTAA